MFDLYRKVLKTKEGMKNAYSDIRAAINDTGYAYKAKINRARHQKILDGKLKNELKDSKDNLEENIRFEGHSSSKYVH